MADLSQVGGQLGATNTGGLPAGVPPGSTFVGNHWTGSDIWLGPDGKPILVDPKANAVRTDTTSGPARSPAAHIWGDIKSGIRSTTDDLGITTPDPHKSEEFKRITDAADAFAQFYQQDRGALDQARGLDLDTIAMLRAAAEGQTPSAAENLMRRGIDQGSSQALGLAATLGGANPGMALRAGLEAKNTATARSAAEMAALRAKEMEAARALLAGQTSRGRQIEAANAGQTGNTFSNIVGAPFGAEERAGASNQALWGDVLKTAGTVYAAKSDVSLKENVRPNPAMADDFLSRLNPQSFEYKKPGVNAPAGQRLGVMAQDLPRNDTMTGPDGKKWISADVIGDVLAGLGRVNQKVDAVSGDPRAMTGAGITADEAARFMGGNPRAMTGGGITRDEAARMRGIPAGVDPKQYAAAMDYIRSQSRDVSPMARAAGGMPPNPRQQTDEELGIANQMIDPSIVNSFLAAMGMAR